jgi:hypothetical protein
MAIDITKVLNVIQEKIGSANTSVSTEDLFYLTKAAKAAGSGSVIESYANSDVFPTANNTVKKLAFDELNRTLYMNSDGTWAALDITVPEAAAGASGYSFQGSNYGYTSGGDYPYGSPSTLNTIDKFPFAADADATDVGDLTVARYDVAGQSSSDYGYTSGGDPGTLNVIDKFAFATDGNATDVGDLTVGREAPAGQSSSESGYTSGGGGSSGTTTVDKFPFSSDADATDVGDLTQARYICAGQSSSESGYTSGGRNFNVSPNYLNTIDKFPFASDANATDVGDLTLARYNLTGQSSSEYGYTSGGTSPPYSNVIDKFPFSSDGNATDVGDLIAATQDQSGQSSTDYGYATGGRSTPAALDTIQKFSFSSDGNATDVGNLTVPRRYAAGQQY